jgi:excinuclease ABC subunit C
VVSDFEHFMREIVSNHAIPGVLMPTTLPLSPGIYLFKAADGTVLYIGKAKNIRKRVQSYFKKYTQDWKVDALIKEHATIDYILTPTEQEALLLEASLVSEHKPKYNVLLKEGQPFLYIMVTKDPLPRLALVRTKKTKGSYFGPFLQKQQARSACRYLINTFRLHLCATAIANGCLDYHLGLCAGNCRPDFDNSDYLFRLDLACQVLKKDHKGFLKKLQEKINEYNQIHAFEKARHLVEYLQNFDTIFITLKARFTPKKFESIVAEKIPQTTGIELARFLHLPQPIRTIDCFDISHFQSAALVGSCVRFTNGKPDKDQFRKFNITTITEQNDYAALQEIVARRYRDRTNLPDLVLIDGGKGQRNAVKHLLPETPCISLAKREETIYSDQYPEGVKIDTSTEIGRLLIALRDYAHHFAISFHRSKRLKNTGE